VIEELRGVVADLRKQVESQQAHIHRLVKLTFGRGGERVEGPTLFDAMAPPETSPPLVETAAGHGVAPRRGVVMAGAASRRTCRGSGSNST
jgi:hypothetical protein